MTTPTGGSDPTDPAQAPQSPPSGPPSDTSATDPSPWEPTQKAAVPDEVPDSVPVTSTPGAGPDDTEIPESHSPADGVTRVIRTGGLSNPSAAQPVPPPPAEGDIGHPLRQVDRPLEEAGRMAEFKPSHRRAVEGEGLGPLGIGDEGARDERPGRPMQAKHAKGIGVAAADDCLNRTGVGRFGRGGPGPVRLRPGHHRLPLGMPGFSGRSLEIIGGYSRCLPNTAGWCGPRRTDQTW